MKGSRVGDSYSDVNTVSDKKKYSYIVITLLQIDHTRILGVGLQVSCNGGLCRENITKKRFAIEKTPRISLSCYTL